MIDHTFTSAWNCWIDGEKLALLYGLKIYWLVRAGKVLQFVGALAVLAEIVGPDRMRQMGSQLQAVYTFESMLRGARDAATWPINLWLSKFGSEERGRQADFKIKRMGVHASLVFNVALALLAAIVVALRIEAESLFGKLVFGGLAFLIVNSVIGPVVSAVLIISLNAVRLFIAKCVIEPIGGILTNDKAEASIKTTAILFVSVGFLLDMLGS